MLTSEEIMDLMLLASTTHASTIPYSVADYGTMALPIAIKPTQTDTLIYTLPNRYLAITTPITMW